MCVSTFVWTCLSMCVCVYLCLALFEYVCVSTFVWPLFEYVYLVLPLSGLCLSMGVSLPLSGLSVTVAHLPSRLTDYHPIVHSSHLP